MRAEARFSWCAGRKQSDAKALRAQRGTAGSRACASAAGSQKRETPQSFFGIAASRVYSGHFARLTSYV
jgi:hypothetical protein